MVKIPPAVQETWVQFLGWEDPLEEEKGYPLQYSCLENPHGQRSLAGYSPWVRKESDMTEQLSTQRMEKTSKYSWWLFLGGGLEVISIFNILLSFFSIFSKFYTMRKH